MKRFYLTFLIISTFTSFAQDSTSVLFIGNSYTYVNDLPAIFNQLTNSLGDIATVDSRTQGGARFQTHAENNLTYSKLQEKPWDYVILQGQSQEPSFPEVQVNTESLPYAKQIADSIYTYKYCTEMMLFMTWGYENGDSQWGPISTYEGMQSRLRNAYLRIGDSCEASVAPIGMAWKYTRENHPTIDLYSSDGSHPSYAGSYLAACTFYASIYRKTPVGASYTGSLDAITAGYLQEAAFLAALAPDSMQLFHLRPFSEHTIADFTSEVVGGEVSFTNNSWKAQSYLWDFGDGNQSTDEHPTHVYTDNNSYAVSLTAESECNNGIDNQTIDIISLGVSTMQSSDYILKNFGDGLYELILPHSNFSEFQLFDDLGRTIKEESVISKSIQLDLSVNKKGIYYLILDEQQMIRIFR